MKSELKNGVLTIEEAAATCGGRLLREGEPPREIRALCTDSREAGKGVLFVADAGERVDGHDYMASAMTLGTRLFLCARVPEAVRERGEPFAAILVEEPFCAMARIAAAYRRRIDPIRIAVTGSVGKTTTKEFIGAVVSQAYRTHKTEGNFNSVIGMPMSLFTLTSDTEATVLEMGMSGRGEIERMSRAAEPHIAVITNIGSAHMELLGSYDNIRRAKFEIVAGMPENGVLILNGDDPRLVAGAAEAKGVEIRFVAIDALDAALRATNLRRTETGMLFDLIEGERIEPDLAIPTPGRHAVYDALFAVAVGRLLGMPWGQIRAGLAGFKNTGMRQNIYTWKGVTLLEDCYNANPESMRAALGVLAETAASARIAVLGDMRELGAGAEEMHRALGVYAAERGIDRLFTYGPCATHIAEGARSVGMAAERIHVNPDDGAPDVTGEALLACLQTGDAVLFKASRSVAAERIIDYLKEHR